MAISEAHMVFVERLRNFLGDRAELNKLSNAEESSDSFLYECISDALDEVNMFHFPTTYTLDTFPYWSTLKLGGVLQVLIGKGILSARNTLTYQDTGGVTVQDFDTYGRYINFYNVLVNKYRNSVFEFKRGVNISAGYGGVGSEYGHLAGVDIIDL